MNIYRNRHVLALTAALALGPALPVLAADDFFWISPAGGGFGIAANWDPVGVPGEEDTAIFGLDSTYGVLFDGDHENLLVRIREGVVTFDIGEHEYRLLGAAPVHVGINAGDDATLRIVSGTLLGTYPTASGNTSVIGGATGASGTVLVTGQDAVWSQPRRVVIGQSGTGALRITDGGTVEITDLASHWIGENSGGLGELLVSGPGSSFDGGRVGVVHEIGRSGTGTVTVEDGGFVRLSNPRLGRNAGSVGTVVVSGEGSFLHGVMPTVTAFLTEIGRAGEGTLIVEDGATALFGHINGLDSLTPARLVRMAVSSSGHGTLIVRDPGSRLIVNQVDIGRSGTAVVTVEGGGTVESGSVNMARNSGSSGDLTVTGAGSTWDAGGSFRVGGDSSPGGAGTLTIGPGAIVSVENTFKVWEDEGNTLIFTLAGPQSGDDYGTLEVGNLIDLSGAEGSAGTLRIVLDDYSPAPGDAFKLFDFAELEGEFSVLDLPDLPAALRWSTTLLYTDGILVVACPPDWNGDSVVDSDDLLEFLADWSAGNADYNGDGVTDSDDLLEFVSDWTAGC